MLKRIFAALLSAGALLGSALCVNAAEADTKDAANMAIKLGDADNNGAINAVDASIILSNYARYSTSTDKPSDYELITQDVNSDSLVNAVDASIVLSYYAYTSIGGTFTLPEYLKAPNEAPTESVTATTTAAATTTTTTAQTTTEPTTYEYTLENITQSAEVFNYFAEKMNNDIYDGSNVKSTRFNGEEYWANGSKESRVALLLLNENANYKNGVLNEVLRGYSDYDIAQGVYYFYNAPSTQDTCETNIDFNDYALDKEIGDYMNKLNAARKHGDDTGDYSEMDAILGEFFYSSQYEKAYHNMASFYYTIGAGGYTPECSYHGDCCSLADDGNFYGIQEIVEGKVKELIK